MNKYLEIKFNSIIQNLTDVQKAFGSVDNYDFDLTLF
jgi:hypothetical protein